MSTSGSKNYSITRSDIIEAALAKTGQFDAGETISGADTKTASRALNLMVKEWVARGIDIWLRDDVTLFLQNDTQHYALGTTYATTDTYVETTLSASKAASATSLSVTSSSGMTAADYIGIKLDDNSIHWDTIASVDSATTITITSGLASAAASGKKVYSFTNLAGRPQEIVYAYRSDKNGIDNEVTIVGEKEYKRQSNKASSGPPVEIYYQPTLTTGTLYVWPVNGGADWDKLVLSCNFLPDDFDASSNNPEFPIEWGNALVWGLAAELGPEYGLSEREQAKLFRIAEFKLNELLDYDIEDASVIFELGER